MGTDEDGFRGALFDASRRYHQASGETFAGHPVAQAIRDLAPRVQAEVGGEFVVRSGAGQGRWAETPWIAIMHPAITTTPMSGFYVVYLIRGDGSGTYLSLNQGITAVRERSNSFVDALRRQASAYREQLIAVRALANEPTSLALHARGARSRAYEAAVICARFYPTAELGSAQLRKDLVSYLIGYRSLVESALSAR